MSPHVLASIPFILHIIVELPAAVSFAFFPSATLLIPQPHAQGVVRQYALLLISTIIVAAVFIPQTGKGDWAEMQERGVAGALALYHLGPLIRAAHRSWEGEGSERPLLGQPWLHMFGHVLCCLSLAGRGGLWW